MGSRDGRRGTADLVTATPRPRWTRPAGHLGRDRGLGRGAPTWSSWASCSASTRTQGVQGRAAVVVGRGRRGGVTAFSAAGFAVGAFCPSRFAAPLAAFGGFLVMTMSSQTGFSHTSGWALILPTNSNGNYQPASGIFYPYLPDLPIARMMFLAGIAVVALGLLGLPAGAGRPAAAAGRRGGHARRPGRGRDRRRAGRAPPGSSRTAWSSRRCTTPPATGRIAYTPVCGRAAGVPVCLNPAYRSCMPDVTAALRPVLSEVAGLPGAPVRATQVAGAYSRHRG